MPFIRIDISRHFLPVRMVPSAWLQPAAIYFSYVIMVLFTAASRVNTTPMALHGLSLGGLTARVQRRLAWGFVGVLMLGVVISGIAHLYVGYHNTVTLGGAMPINEWGRGQLRDANYALMDYSRGGVVSRPIFNQTGQLLFGAGVTAGLYAACLSMPRWPFHPIGFLMANTYYPGVSWFSILIGWLIKTALLKYGGSRAYRAARPIFTGLIVGELAAAIAWAAIPAIAALLGWEYRQINIVPT